jgi:hypothetical protein
MKEVCMRHFSPLRARSILALAFAALAGCGPLATSTPPGLTLEQLANTEYESPTPAEGTIRLTDGEFRQAAAPGSASEISVALLPDLVALGDLDGDGHNDAAVMLAGDSGGSGTFISLAALLNEDGSPRHAATAFLGDRVRVTFVAIDSGEITVELVSHGPADPLCCPTLATTRRFRLNQGSLVEVSAAP